MTQSKPHIDSGARSGLTKTFKLTMGEPGGKKSVNRLTCLLPYVFTTGLVPTRVYLD